MTDLKTSFTVVPLTPLSTATATTGTTSTGTTTLTFYHVSGAWISSLQTLVDRTHRVGANATIAQSVGTQGRDITFPASSAFTTKALAIAFIANVEALQGVICKITDAWGRTLPRVRVFAAAGTPIQCLGPTVGGTQINYRVDCQLTCERLTDT